MSKAKAIQLPGWVRNLRAMMETRGFNPRSLSLRAGLNSTAVRDMLEGRSRFPRYDTALALADALGTTPARLMADGPTHGKAPANDEAGEQGVDLLTEIITRLQEVAVEMGHQLDPRAFAAMASSIYRRLQEDGGASDPENIKPRVHDLLDYELLRQKRDGK